MEVLGRKIEDILPGLVNNPPEKKEGETPSTIETQTSGDPKEDTPKAEETQVATSSPFGEILEDDFVQKFLSAYSGEEDGIEELLQSELDRVRIAKTDYVKMSDEDVIRASLQLEWPELKGAAFERAVKKYFDANFGEEIEVFDDDEETQSEKQVRDAQIRRKANELRKYLEAEQSKFKRKSAAETKAEKEARLAEARKKAEDDFATWEKMVTSDAFISKALAEGEVRVGKADSELGYRVKDLEKFKKALVDDNSFFTVFSTGDQKNPVDFKRWAKVVAYALDPEGFENLIYASGKNAATGKLLDELENPAKPDTIKPSSPSTLSQALLGAISKRR